MWELPINELDRREDPDFEEKLTGCALVSSCSNVYTKEHFKRVLQQGRLHKHKHGELRCSIGLLIISTPSNITNTLGSRHDRPCGMYRYLCFGDAHKPLWNKVWCFLRAQHGAHIPQSLLSSSLSF